MNLKKLRLQAEKTQQTVAKDLNITQATYSNYEKEVTCPDPNMLIKLADYFHTTIDSIIGHDVPYLIDKGLLTNEQNMLIEEIKSLSKTNCQYVYAYIQGLKRGEENQEYIKNKFKGE